MPINFKKLLTGLTVAGITLFLLFVLLEISIRAIRTESDNLIMQNPVLGWVHVPNKNGYSRSKEFSVKVRINKDGFIGRNYGYSKPENTVRILVMGDSVTEAFQVPEEESYSRLLEEILKDNFKNTNFEVLNMGIAGYGTQKEYYVLKDKGLKFNPDITVLGFFTGNDFSDNMSENINPEASFSKYRELKNRIKLFARNHSAVWRFILRKKSKNKVLAYLLNKNNVNAIDAINNEKDSRVDIKEQLDRSTALIRDIKKLADGNSTALVVAILPSAGQVYGKDGNSDESELRRGLTVFLEDERINYVDLLPHFVNWDRINPDKVGYHLLDGHPNMYGQSVIAEGIGGYLSEFLMRWFQNPLNNKNGNF